MIRFLGTIGRFVSAILGIGFSITTCILSLGFYVEISEGQAQESINNGIIILLFFVATSLFFLRLGYPNLFSSIKGAIQYGYGVDIFFYSILQNTLNFFLIVARFISRTLGIVSTICTILMIIDLSTAIFTGRDQEYINGSIIGLVFFTVVTLIFLKLGFPTFLENIQRSIFDSIDNLFYSLSQNTTVGFFVAYNFLKNRVYLLLYTLLIFAFIYSEIFYSIEKLSSKWVIFGIFTFCLLLVQLFIFKSRIPNISLPSRPSQSSIGSTIGSAADGALSFFTGMPFLRIGRSIGSAYDRDNYNKSFQSYEALTKQSVQNYVQHIILLIFSFVIEIILGIFITFEFINYPQAISSILTF